ncbi:MAG: S8 family serine peptidase [Acidimicrobiia bacterium]|nr:S8 family serine peptidase [Acidimicrobiia bacterium]
MERIGTRFSGALVLLSALAVMFGLVGPVVGVEAAPAPESPAEGSIGKIDEDLQRVFETDSEAEFLVLFSEDADTRAAVGMSDWEERGRFVYETLTRHAEETQADVISDLEAMGAEYKSYWIVNTVLVKGTSATANSLAAQPEVESIVPATDFQIPIPERVKPANEVAATEWGLDAINIPEVWDQYGATGEGIVVGVIDSGAQWDHPALIGSYRGNDNGTVDHDYNWFDPTRFCGDPSPEPCDQMRHGTHVTGTIAGDDGAENQIGVAPDVEWIAGLDVTSFPTTAVPRHCWVPASGWLRPPTPTATTPTPTCDLTSSTTPGVVTVVTTGTWSWSTTGSRSGCSPSSPVATPGRPVAPRGRRVTTPRAIPPVGSTSTATSM